MPYFSTVIIDVPGGAFGLYWGVTVLLTGTVIGAWALWMWREARTRNGEIGLIGK